MPLKPEDGTPLNTAHPLAQGMLSCLPCLEGSGQATRDLVTGADVTVQFIPSTEESSLVHNGGSETLASYPLTNGHIYPAFTVAFRCKMGPVSNQNSYLYNGEIVNFIFFNNHPTYSVFRQTDPAITPTGSLVDNQTFDVVLTWDGVSEFVLYEDGAASATLSRPAGSTDVLAGRDGALQIAPFAYGNPGDPYTVYAYFYGRALSASEAAALHTDPYQMLGAVSPAPTPTPTPTPSPAALTIGAVKSDNATATQVMLSLTAAPAGGTSPLGVQWYRQPAGGTVASLYVPGNALGGATAAALTDTPPSASVFEYGCRVTDAAAQTAQTPLFAAQTTAQMAAGGTLNAADVANIALAVQQKMDTSSLRLAGLHADVAGVQTVVNCLPTAVQIGAAVGALSIESGESLVQNLRLLRAVLAGNRAVPANGPLLFYRADGTTVAVTFSLVGTDRATATPGSL